MPYRSSLALGGLAIALLLLAPRAASALTLIPVSDDDLALSSRAIVEGRCVALEPVYDPEANVVFTYVTFDVTTVHKGDLEPGTIVLKELGGATGGHKTLVEGATYWEPGWRMLLFLNTDDAGALHVAYLSLGFFRVLGEGSGAEMVVRPATAAHVLPQPGAARVTDRAPLAEYVAAIRETLARDGEAAAEFEAERADVPVRRVPLGYAAGAAAGPGDDSSDFGLLGSGFRWFEPDSGAPVRFRLNSSEAPTPSGGADEAAAAAEAWSTVPGSSLRVQVGPSTNACALRADGASAISFGDCGGQIDRPVNCTGVVALGGVSAANPNETRSIGGRTFARIREADVVFADGFECLLSNPQVAAEVLTHEMGHALGFGHSSERRDEPSTLLREATMFFILHQDGRGASLRGDDMDAASFLYRANASGTSVAIVTGALPDAPLGSPYSFPLRAAGSGPFTWTVVDGDLPEGLALSANGMLSGTAAAEQVASFTVRVRDGANFEMTRTLELRATRTPAPFVESADFKRAQGKLVVRGRYLDGSASISINGAPVAPPSAVRFKTAKSQLVVKGMAADLNLRSTGPNSIVVTVAGRASNAVQF